jgi:hypothetical protein
LFQALEKCEEHTDLDLTAEEVDRWELLLAVASNLPKLR